MVYRKSSNKSLIYALQIFFLNENLRFISDRLQISLLILREFKDYYTEIIRKLEEE